MSEADELLTVDEVAEMVRVNPETVRRWIKSGRLSAARPAGKPQGPYRIHSADVAWLLGGLPKVEAPHSPEISEESERRIYDDTVERWARLAPLIRDFEDLTPAQRREVFDAVWRLFKMLADMFDRGFKRAVADTMTHVLIGLRRMLDFYELQRMKGSTEDEIDFEGYRRRIRLRVS